MLRVEFPLAGEFCENIQIISSYTILKVPISQIEDFYSNDASSPKKSWFKISVKSVKPFGHKKRLHILQLPIPYCVSLIMVTITSHIFQTVHFSAVKFTRGNEKNMTFLLIPKFQKVWKNFEAIGPGSFKWNLTILLLYMYNKLFNMLGIWKYSLCVDVSVGFQIQWIWQCKEIKSSDWYK